MLKLVLTLAALALAGCGGAPSPEAPPQAHPAPMSADSDAALFEFADGEPQWRVVNDGVMGGESEGILTVEDGTLRFTGELVTAGGGFTSARVLKSADLSAYSALELRVRGGGRLFEVEVNDATRNRRREVSRRAPFITTSEWQVVRVPFADLAATAFGEPVDVAPLDRAHVESFGIFIADGRDGPFEIEVDWIRAVE